jgi:ubiquinone/menaquinone biosynthesis C-methylase UbiE
MDSTARFSDRVDAYARYRPHYPKEILPFLRKNIGLTPAMPVADIGSGTGISAELFLKNGNTVYCVEPNGPMRKKAEERFQGLPGFISVDGRAEKTGIADRSVDVIIAAQAFHWFDQSKARKEFLRVGRIGAWTVVTWNDRRLGSPFELAYEELLLKFGTDYTSIDHRNIPAKQIVGWYGTAGCTIHQFDNEQVLGSDELRGRVLSTSYVPGPGEPNFDAMLRELKQLFDRHQAGGKVVLGYETRLYCGRVFS